MTMNNLATQIPMRVKHHLKTAPVNLLTKETGCAGHKELQEYRRVKFNTPWCRIFIEQLARENWILVKHQQEEISFSWMCLAGSHFWGGNPNMFPLGGWKKSVV